MSLSLVFVSHITFIVDVPLMCHCVYIPVSISSSWSHHHQPPTRAGNTVSAAKTVPPTLAPPAAMPPDDFYLLVVLRRYGWYVLCLPLPQSESPLHLTAGNSESRPHLALNCGKFVSSSFCSSVAFVVRLTLRSRTAHTPWIWIGVPSSIDTSASLVSFRIGFLLSKVVVVNSEFFLWKLQEVRC